jgi:acyl-CoA thioesterase FadM
VFSSTTTYVVVDRAFRPVDIPDVLRDHLGR